MHSLMLVVRGTTARMFSDVPSCALKLRFTVEPFTTNRAKTEIGTLGNSAVNNWKILPFRYGIQRCQIIHRSHTLSMEIKICSQDSPFFVNAYVQFPLRDPVVDLRLNPSDRYDGFHHCAMMYYVREHSLFVFPSEVKEDFTSSPRGKKFL